MYVPYRRICGTLAVWSSTERQDQKLELWSLTVPESMCSPEPELQVAASLLKMLMVF